MIRRLPLHHPVHIAQWGDLGFHCLQMGLPLALQNFAISSAVSFGLDSLRQFGIASIAHVFLRHVRWLRRFCRRLLSAALVTPLQSSAERDLIPGSRYPGVNDEDAVFPCTGIIVWRVNTVLDGGRKQNKGNRC